MTHKKTKGVTLLLAVFISTMALTLGIGVFNLVYGQLRLSGAAKESFIAFYAADSGVECALYWDWRVAQEEESTVFPANEDEADEGSETIECNGDSEVEVSVLSSISNAATSTFSLTFVPSGCVDVIVGKTSAGSTVIESRGRNECGPGVNPGRVERALRVRY